MAILRHPTLEGWFLALEQQAIPPHALSPVLVKLLAAHLSAGVLQLLLASAPVLQRTGQRGLLAKYSEAITQSVLKELRHRRTGSATSPPKTLPQLEALQGLHPYMEGTQLREVTLALLSLPEVQLVAQRPPKSPGKERHLNALGKTLVQLLTSGPWDQLQSGELLWASEFVRGLGALLPALAVDELDAVLLHTLQREPALAPAVGVHVLDYCLARRTQAALGIAALLLPLSCTHVLRFELWCARPGAGLGLQERLDDFLPLLHAYLRARTQGRFARPAGGTGAVGSGQPAVLSQRAVSDLEFPRLGCGQSSLSPPDTDPALERERGGTFALTPRISACGVRCCPHAPIRPRSPHRKPGRAGSRRSAPGQGRHSG